MGTMADVFTQNGFTEVSTTVAINKMPPTENLMEQLGLFTPTPIATDVAVVEDRDGTLALIPTSNRGGAGTAVADGKRNKRNFTVPHIQVDDSVYANEIQNVVAFGSTSAENLNNVVSRKQENAKRSIDATIEYLRIGAIKGIVAYPAGSVDADLNLFDEFGTTQQTQAFTLANAATEVVKTVIPELRDKMETALGQAVYKIGVLCPRTFFRALIAHAKVEEIYTTYRAMLAATPVSMRTGLMNRQQVEIDGVIFYEYYNSIGGVASLTTNAQAFPIGMPDAFLDVQGPADFFAAVNTMGLPYYSRVILNNEDKFQKLESQANRLQICTRPRSLILCTVA